MKYKIQSSSTCSATVDSDAVSYTEGNNVSLDQESYNSQYVCFWSTDSSNNVGSARSTQISGIDLTAPTVTVSSITGTGSKVVSATDNDGGTTTMKYEIQSGSSCSATVPEDAVSYTEGSDVSLNQESYNSKYVCFWSTDPSNNVGKARSAQISGIDVTAPTVTVSSITGAGIKNVSATDDDAGTTVMKYKIQSSSTCSATVPDDAASYTEGSDLSLDDESYNSKYVCFWSTDASNNVGKAKSAQISGVDRTAPTVTVSYVIGSGITNVSAVDDDAGTTVMKYKIQSANGCSATVPDDASSYTEGNNVSLDNRSYSGLYACFWSVDTGNNIGVGISNQILVLDSGSALSSTSGSFVSVWNTTSTSDGSSNSTSISLPLEEGGNYNFIVDWGDGTSRLVTSWDSANASHDYGTGNGGIKTINITGLIEGFRFNNEGDKLKLINITNWGFLKLGNNGRYFFGASNLEDIRGHANLTGTTDLSRMFFHAAKFNGNISHWNVSEVTNMMAMFAGHFDFDDWEGTPNIFNQDISGWDTSKVTNMRSMFYHANKFNQSIGSWNTSSVTTMRSMFYEASDFNQDLSGWDTSKVTDMRWMFYFADSDETSFNGNVSSWNTSSVTNMRAMFAGASKFNGNISSWDVSKVTDMRWMFYSFVGSDFNQDIGDWDVSNVTTMEGMFEGATSFNQDIGNWNMSKVTNLEGMFYTPEGSSFNQDISGWDVSNVVNMNLTFSYAAEFNQDISGWDVSKVTGMYQMFYNASSFDQDLSGWNVCNVLSYTEFDMKAANWSDDNKPKLGHPCVVNVSSPDSDGSYGLAA